MTYHCNFDLDYLLHRGGARQMAGHVRLPGAKEWATEAEVLTHATLLKMRGMEVMPTCGNHDARGYCNGHAEA
jgi:hypothetical protein